MNTPFYLKTDSDIASEFLYNSGEIIAYVIIDLHQSKRTIKQGHYVMSIDTIEVHEFHDHKCKNPFYDVIRNNEVERCFSYTAMLALVTYHLPSKYIFEAKARLNLALATNKE